ncbi:unnamed protein product [Pleuronectes platessa]|uniref:Uncharacterized protein n=1 Tax=Pleuronectes platessa TaxID=8262 RepID=A0A9N7YPG2_PLEPL|nr:unnamed protein product [Pleuronectes platessa]
MDYLTGRYHSKSKLQCIRNENVQMRPRWVEHVGAERPGRCQLAPLLSVIGRNDTLECVERDYDRNKRHSHIMWSLHESRYMALEERANASRAPLARLARELMLTGEPGSRASVSSQANRASGARLALARAAATRQTFKWPHKQGTPGTPLNVDSTVWKDAAAAPAQAPTAPTAGLRWGAGALAARLTGGEGGGALKTGQSEEDCFRQGKKVLF